MLSGCLVNAQRFCCCCFVFPNARSYVVLRLHNRLFSKCALSVCPMLAQPSVFKMRVNCQFALCLHNRLFQMRVCQVVLPSRNRFSTTACCSGLTQLFFSCTLSQVNYHPRLQAICQELLHDDSRSNIGWMESTEVKRNNNNSGHYGSAVSHQ